MQRTILAIAILGFLNADAQHIFKGGGTSNSTFLLGNTLATHTQCLYFPADLTNSQSGDITRLYYRYGTTGIANGNTLTGLLIRMGQTTATGFNGTTFYTGLITVLNAPSFSIAPGSTGDWFPIDLDVQFPYDVTQTLIIDIQFDSTMTNNFGCYGGANNDVKLYSGDNTSPTGALTSTTLQDVGFDLEQLLTVNGPQVLTENVRLYPNPATDNIILSWDAEAPRSIKLLDASGRVLEQHTDMTGDRLILDLQHYEDGQYLLQCIMPNGKVQSRAISKVS